MRRVEIAPRSLWQQRCEALGFDFHTSGSKPYWNESAVYEFTAEDVATVETAAAELHRISLLAVEHVVQRDLLSLVGVPKKFHAWVSDSWRRRDPALLSRFDFAYAGHGQPKLLEYNADTPASLLESSVVQWHWLEDVRPQWDQFNTLHERLLARWREILPEGAFVHFVCLTESVEDVAHLRYLLDTLKQAGRDGTVMDMRDIGLTAGEKPRARQFVDRYERPINYAFKQYPWEWLFADPFCLLAPTYSTRFLEPPWRAVLQSKALLPLLWELFPHHPNLLPAFWSPKPFNGAPYVRKPILSREGANVRIVGVKGGSATSGPYGGPMIYQTYAPLFEGSGKHAVVGAWMVGDSPAGMSVREDAKLIVTGESQFVPHTYQLDGDALGP